MSFHFGDYSHTEVKFYQTEQMLALESVLSFTMKN